MAYWTGLLAVVALLGAAVFPLGYRVRFGKRALPTSKPIKTHVVIGFMTLAFAFVHTLCALPDLGTPAAAGGGMLALLPAGAAFFLLIAHAGLGIQLRQERLRDRVSKRRKHAWTAALITLAIVVHVVALEYARRS